MLLSLLDQPQAL